MIYRRKGVEKEQERRKRLRQKEKCKEGGSKAVWTFSQKTSTLGNTDVPSTHINTHRLLT